MVTMNVSLPEQMKVWAEKQSHNGQYANVSDYVRDLIRRDRERHEKISHMQSLVQDGLDSGVGTLSMEELRIRAKSAK